MDSFHQKTDAEGETNILKRAGTSGQKRFPNQTGKTKKRFPGCRKAAGSLEKQNAVTKDAKKSALRKTREWPRSGGKKKGLTTPGPTEGTVSRPGLKGSLAAEIRHGPGGGGEGQGKDRGVRSLLHGHRRQRGRVHCRGAKTKKKKRQHGPPAGPLGGPSHEPK